MVDVKQSALLRLILPVLAARLGGEGVAGAPAAPGGGVGALEAVPADPVLPTAQGGEPAMSFGRATPPPQDPFFAPGGPNINFFGGSPFPAQDRTRQVLAGLVLGSRVLEVAKAAKDAKKKAEQAARKAQGGQ